MPRESARRAIDLLIGESSDLNAADRSVQALAVAERAVLAARRLGDADLLVRALTAQASAQRLPGENSRRHSQPEAGAAFLIKEFDVEGAPWHSGVT